MGTPMWVTKKYLWRDMCTFSCEPPVSDEKVSVTKNEHFPIRAERRRREVRRWEHPKRNQLDLYLGPRIPLGLAVHRPILAYSWLLKLGLGFPWALVRYGFIPLFKIVFVSSHTSIRSNNQPQTDTEANWQQICSFDRPRSYGTGLQFIATPY